MMPTGSHYTGIKVASIAGGSVIDTMSNDITFSHTNLINTPVEPGRFIGSPYNYRLPQSDYHGHSAPTVTIKGRIISGDTIPDRVTLGILGSIMRCGSYVYFWDNKTFEFNAQGSISTLPTSFQFTKNTQTWGKDDFGYAIDYTLTLVETRDSSNYPDPTS